MLPTADISSVTDTIEANGWHFEGEQAIIIHRGHALIACISLLRHQNHSYDTRITHEIKSLNHARHPKITPHVHNSG